MRQRFARWGNAFQGGSMRAIAGMSWLFGALIVAGCQTTQVYRENPTTVVNSQYDTVWEHTIDVLDDYFEIASENRFTGEIVLQPLASATLLEPWRKDAVDLAERTEATFQTIRRKGYVQVLPAPTGGFSISVEIYKELEHLPGLEVASFGSATSVTSLEPTTEKVVSSPVPPSLGWISQGRDEKLEAKIIDELRRRIDHSIPALSSPFAPQ